MSSNNFVVKNGLSVNGNVNITGNLVSPTITGTPTSPTATAGTNTTQIATTAFVTSAINALPANVTSFNTRTGAVTLTSGDVTTALGFTPVNNSTVGANNGLATLNSSGQLTSSQIPSSIVGAVVYQGTWNANTNTPTLTSSTGTKGNYYKVSVAGSTTLDGINSWNVGDTVIFDGTTWDKIDGIASEVLSVAGRTGVVTLAVADVTGAAPLASPSFTGTTSFAGDVTMTGSGNALTVTSGLANGVTIAGNAGAPTIGTTGGDLMFLPNDNNVSIWGTAGCALKLIDNQQGTDARDWRFLSTGGNLLIGPANDALSNSLAAYQINRGTTFNVSSHTWNTSTTAGTAIQGMQLTTTGLAVSTQLSTTGMPFFGTSTATGAGGHAQGSEQVGTSGASNAAYGRWSNDINGVFFSFYKSRGTTVGSHAAISPGDNIGIIAGTADDGTNVNTQAAWITLSADANGTISSGVVPGQITLSTANSSGVLTTAAIIDKNQNLGIGGSPNSSYKVDISAGSLGVRITGGGGYLTLNSTTTGYTTIFGQDNGTQRWAIGQTAFGGSDGLAFYTGAAQTERSRFASSGRFLVNTTSDDGSHQLQVNGTISATSPAAGDNTTTVATSSFVQATINSILNLSVAGGSNVTLTATQALNAIMVFTGALTANINVIVPATAKDFVVYNKTTGAFTLTIKTASGTGITVTQGLSQEVFCDGTNVLQSTNDFKSIALTGVPTAPTAAGTDNSTTIATTAFVQGLLNAPSFGGNVGIGTTGQDFGGYGKVLTINPASGQTAALEVGYNGNSLAAFEVISNGAAANIRVTGAVPFGIYINGTQRLLIDSSGHVMLGYSTSNGSYNLQVNSQIFATSATIATSDAQFKTNIVPISTALNIINNLNPVEFDFIPNEVHNFPTGRQIGFIAQEVQTALNGTDYENALVFENETEATSDSPATEFLGLADAGFTPLIVKSIQELSSLVNSLQATVNAQAALITQLQNK